MIVGRALEMAAPGETVEIFLEDSRASTVTVVDGQAEASEERADQGAGIRVYGAGRVGFAFTSDLSGPGLQAAVARARSLAAHTRHQKENIPPAAAPAGAAQACATERGHGFRLELGQAMETAAREAAGEGARTRAASVTESSGRTRIASSAGLDHAWDWSRAWAYVEIIAQRDGIRQTGFESGWDHGAGGLDAAAIGREAGRRAARKFGGVQPETGRTWVVLDPHVTAGLFETLAAALSAKNVLRGRSMFKDRVGQQVAGDRVALVDDGTHPRGFATAPVDGEGVPSRRTVLMEAGVLRGYLHDTYTGACMETGSTGHAVRDAYTSVPAVSTRNLYLEPSGETREAILAQVEEGIYVDEVMGLHTVDPVTGDFSLGGVGRRLRGGEFGEPLEGFALAGNAAGLLRAVQAVGSDLRFQPGGAGGSTVLLRDMMVGGR